MNEQQPLSGYGQYEFQRNKPYRPMSEVTGNAFEVYTNLKMGVLFMRGYQRAIDGGSTPGEAVKAGVVDAAAWMSFICFTITMPLWLCVPLVQILDYAGPGQPMYSLDMSPTRLWIAISALGTLSLVTQIVSWLVLYSKLKDRLQTKRGRVYQCGFRIRRRFFLLAPWWPFAVAVMVANIPIFVFLGA